MYRSSYRVTYIEFNHYKKHKYKFLNQLEIYTCVKDRQKYFDKDEEIFTEYGIHHTVSDGILDQLHLFPNPCNVYLEGASE